MLLEYLLALVLTPLLVVCWVFVQALARQPLTEEGDADGDPERGHCGQCMWAKLGKSTGEDGRHKRRSRK
jgi:hypothetical protein